MNIYELRDNLKQTIAGKEKYLLDYLKDTNQQKLVRNVMIEFVEINLAELKKILADVETCCEQSREASWKGSVDRQGGSFDNSEINRETW